MPKMLNPTQASLAANAKIRKQGTVFAAHCDPQTVPAKALRGVTYVYPPGPRRTGKPDKYRA